MHRRLLASGTPGGCTATVVYVEGACCWVANVGDTRVCVVGADGTAARATVDHRADNEAEAAAVRARGGFVTHFGGRAARVNGILAVTRALGDREVADVISSTPDVAAADFGAGRAATLVLACDGLWDYVSDATVAALLAAAGNEREAAEALRNYAYAHDSADNISVLVIKPRHD